MILKLIYTYQYNVLLHGKHGILSEFWITAFISLGEMCYHLNLFIEMFFSQGTSQRCQTSLWAAMKWSLSNMTVPAILDCHDFKSMLLETS